MDAQAIYDRSPPFLRDVWVTLYGSRLARRRYNGVFREYFAIYRRAQRSSEAALFEEQKRLYDAFLTHAIRHSPFYREFYAGADHPTDLRRGHELPILTKELLRENLSRIFTGPVTGKLIAGNTSGTTGTPLNFYYDPNDVPKRWAALESWKSWHGVAPGDRRASFSGRPIKPERDRSRRVAQMNWAIRQRFYSTYHLTPGYFSHYVTDLNRFQPVYLEGYASALVILARHLLASGTRLGFRPRVIFCTGETLAEHDREAISRGFACPVRNQYSSSEGAPFVVECERGNLHLLTYTGVVEIVDDEGHPAASGQCLVTGFHTHFMPLIRYRIGDEMVASSESTCPCGRELPRIERILGRQEAAVITSERGAVRRLNLIFKHIPDSIVKSRIEQNRVDEVDFLYVPDRHRFDESHLEILRRELIARLGKRVRISFREVEELRAGRNGKFHAVVCNLSQNSPSGITEPPCQ